jgi:hypothetical protein
MASLGNGVAMKAHAMLGMDSVLVAGFAVTTTLLLAAPVQIGQLVTAAFFCF